MIWQGATVAITGGTGSLGRALTRRLLREDVRAIRIISRDEAKHAAMASQFSDERIKYLIGDVRDRDRLDIAFDGVNIVVHAAALKRVEQAELHPLEFVATNVRGTENVLRAARDSKVARVLTISTDKACQPVTLYGATKMLAERITVAANVYSPNGTRYSAVRYGNVTGSRGSLVPLLLEQRKTGRVTITDDKMTRFWMRMSEAVDLVIFAVEHMKGGEIYVPRCPSVAIRDVLSAVAPGCEVETIGIRGQEKLHESLVAPDEARGCQETPDHFILRPGTAFEGAREFSYTSDANRFLTVDEIAAQYESAMAEAA